MSDNRTLVSCPFCGECFISFTNRAEAEHPPVTECPLFGRILTVDQWNMRPPKKEVGEVPKIDDEVGWLRKLVQALVLEEPEYKVTYDTSSNDAIVYEKDSYSSPTVMFESGKHLKELYEKIWCEACYDAHNDDTKNFAAKLLPHIRELNKILNFRDEVTK